MSTPSTHPGALLHAHRTCDARSQSGRRRRFASLDGPVSPVRRSSALPGDTGPGIAARCLHERRHRCCRCCRWPTTSRGASIVAAGRRGRAAGVHLSRRRRRVAGERLCVCVFRVCVFVCMLEGFAHRSLWRLMMINSHTGHRNTHTHTYVVKVDTDSVWGEVNGVQERGAC